MRENLRNGGFLLALFAGNRFEVYEKFLTILQVVFEKKESNMQHLNRESWPLQCKIKSG